MSIAEATPDFEVEDRNDRAFLGHPKGLGYLAFVEGCASAVVGLIAFVLFKMVVASRMTQPGEEPVLA